MTAGDGKLDLDLIEFGDINFIPIKSEVYNILENDNLLKFNELIIKTSNKELLEKNYLPHDTDFSTKVSENLQYIKDLIKFEKNRFEVK